MKRLHTFGIFMANVSQDGRDSHYSRQGCPQYMALDSHSDAMMQFLMSLLLCYIIFYFDYSNRHQANNVQSYSSVSLL